MKHIGSVILCLIMTIGCHAQSFADHFQNKTLRVDYLFAGNAKQQTIFLDELTRLPSWAGRQHHLNELPLEGNGQIIVRDLATKQPIYKSSFSSLFQEWLSTEEAKGSAKGFENSFLLPYPKQPVEVEVILLTPRKETMTSFKHIVRPDDILIHERGTSHITPHQYLLRNGNERECIDVAILAEGYKESEMSLFYQDAQKACESLLAHEPFKAMKSKFNIIGVASPSADSGVSVPRQNLWKETAFHSHFDTFYSDRYLTTSRVKEIHNALSGIPYEHIIILANTDVYGGGGIYNSYTLTTAHHPMFSPVVVHEFGHSFGGLADEYFYEEDIMTDIYPLDVEPWEQNITTQVNFASKWKNMLTPSTPVPTPVEQKNNYAIGVYEGGGYATKGIYRPAYNCRMRTNEHPEFCPVCQHALRKVIEFYVP